MSVNRIGHMVGPRPLPSKHQQASQTLDMVLEQTPMIWELYQFRRDHPGEQPYLLVLDPTQQIVRDLIGHLPERAERLAAGEAAASVADLPWANCRRAFCRSA